MPEQEIDPDEKTLRFLLAFGQKHNLVTQGFVSEFKKELDETFKAKSKE